MKLGVFVPSLGNNQVTIETIAGLNTLLNVQKDLYPTIFYKEIEPMIVKPKTLATSFDRMYQYDGHVITTNLDATYIALQCRRLKSINFLVIDLEWTFGVGNYLANSAVYKNPNIHLFSPSQQYSLALENYCNVQATTIRGFNLNEIITRIQQRT